MNTTDNLISGMANSLAVLRKRRGLSAIQLAGAAGVSRQTIYAMEAGDYVPNTLVALKLARALDAKVEDLFALGEETAAPELSTEPVVMLSGADEPRTGQPVQLCRVGKRLIASTSSPVRWYLPASDALVTGANRVRPLHANENFESRILIAGCDPGISVLARHVLPTGVQMVLAHRNSSQALKLLKEGSVHIAGTHLRDDATGESNLPAIRRLFPKDAVSVISFAIWEEGIVTARGNPKKIAGIQDLVRPRITIVNREKGSGSRLLLDSHMKRLGIGPRNVKGFDHLASGHIPAAWQVHSELADCCIATRAAARLFGLGFIPLVSERYDLAIRKQHLTLPGVQSLLDVLSRSNFRRELETLGGYDTTATGQRLL